MTSRIFNYPINLTSASGSTIGTIISTTISASNANYTTLTTGTLLVPTSISAASCIATIGTIVGTINGNILTITSENVFSTDTIDWMVIGERKDPFIKT